MVEAAAPVPEMTAPEPAPAAPVAATLDEPSEALLVDDSEVGPPTGEVDMQSLFGDVVGSEDPTPTETIEASATALFGEVGSAEVLDDDLRAEGLAREVSRALNDLRKEQGFRIADRITVRYSAAGALAAAVERHAEWIRGEVLATAIDRLDPTESAVTLVIGDEEFRVALVPNAA